jgi:hypothetical protein
MAKRPSAWPYETKPRPPADELLDYDIKIHVNSEKPSGGQPLDVKKAGLNRAQPGTGKGGA